MAKCKGLIKTIIEKLKEGTSLKDVKHIAKRQTEGDAKKTKNYMRNCEEYAVRQMLADGKSEEAIEKICADEKLGYELHWTAKRITRQFEEAKKDATRTPRVKKEPKPKAEKVAKPKAEKKAPAPPTKPAKKPAVPAKKEAPKAAPAVKRGVKVAEKPAEKKAAEAPAAVAETETAAPATAK